jgi:hypothetical protein
MDRARQFREGAARENRDRSRLGWRYSPALRALAVEYGRATRRAGRAWTEVAGELGVSTLTLSRWLEAAPAASLLPVAIVERQQVSPPLPHSLLAAITPSGLRIEGLVWSEVLDLVRLYR